VNPRATDNLKESAIGSTQLNEYSSDIRKIPEIKYVNFFSKEIPTFSINRSIPHKERYFLDFSVFRNVPFSQPA
jgi:hypothetical protein